MRLNLFDQIKNTKILEMVEIPNISPYAVTSSPAEGYIITGKRLHVRVCGLSIQDNISNLTPRYSANTLPSLNGSDLIKRCRFLPHTQKVKSSKTFSELTEREISSSLPSLMMHHKTKKLLEKCVIADDVIYLRLDNPVALKSINKDRDLFSYSLSFFDLGMPDIYNHAFNLIIAKAEEDFFHPGKHKMLSLGSACDFLERQRSTGYYACLAYEIYNKVDTQDCYLSLIDLTNINLARFLLQGYEDSKLFTRNGDMLENYIKTLIKAEGMLWNMPSRDECSAIMNKLEELIDKRIDDCLNSFVLYDNHIPPLILKMFDIRNLNKSYEKVMNAISFEGSDPK